MSNPSESRWFAELACQRLMVEYARCFDTNRCEEAWRLFTADAVFETRGAGPGFRCEGGDALRAFFRSRDEVPNRSTRRSRHLCTNLLVDVVDERNATGVCYLVQYAHEGVPEGQPAPTASPVLVGDYVDRYVRTEAGWRIAHRRLDILFMKTA